MPTADERGARVAAACEELGVDAVLLCDLDNVTYATGYAGAPELGPSPHAGGPNVAIVARDGTAGLVVPDLEGDDARSSRADLVRTYPAFEARPHPAPLPELLADAVAALVADLGLAGATLAADHMLPAPLRDRLTSDVSGWRDAGAALVRARATKTPAEIDQLRRCAELAGVGQRRAREVAAPGMTELELLGAVRTAIELAADATFVLGVDLLSGVERTAQAMGGPGLRALAAGDPVLCDLGPRVGGYWGDSCTTFVLGEPSSAFAALHAAVEQALYRAAEVIRPGITADELDAAVRGELERRGYADPLHVGHAIGTANFEHPRIVPGATARLEPGMVLMVEPGAYVAGVGGARLEWMFLVTETGSEVLGRFPCGLVP